MNATLKQLTVNWLEGVQSTGGFNGFPEEDMDFGALPEEDLKWYLDSWVLENIDPGEYDNTTMEIIEEYIK